MRKSEMTNAGVMAWLESSIFYAAHHGNSKKAWEEVRKAERELGKRLGLTEEELQKIMSI